MKKLIICLFAILPCYMSAENISVSTGGSGNGVDWNIGQIVTEAIIDDSSIIEQGFFQPDVYNFLSIKTSEMDVSVKTYPNPVKDKLTVELTISDGFDWKLTNILGQSIESGRSHSNAIEIDFSSYIIGHYILSIKSNEGVKSMIIIKK